MKKLYGSGYMVQFFKFLCNRIRVCSVVMWEMMKFLRDETYLGIFIDIFGFVFIRN